MGQVQPGSQVRCKLCFQNSGCAAVIRVFFAKDWKEKQAMLILTIGTCPGHLLVCNPHCVECAFKRKRKRASIDGDRRIKECYGHLTICENPPTQITIALAIVSLQYVWILETVSGQSGK